MATKRTTHKGVRKISVPPQRNLNNKVNSLGALSRPIIITIVAVAAIALLSVLILFSTQFVGKAIELGTVLEGRAGISLADNTVKVGETFTIPIVANLGNKKTTSFSFDLTYDTTKLKPSGTTCDYRLADETSIGGNDLTILGPIFRCNLVTGEVHLEVAWLCADAECSNAITGLNKFAEITFEAIAAGSAPITVTDFKIYDIDTQENIIKPASIISASINVQTAGVQVEEQFSCVDSDNTDQDVYYSTTDRSYDTQGSVTIYNADGSIYVNPDLADFPGSNTDYCNERGVLIETYCYPDNYLKGLVNEKQITCGTFGKVCVDGACVTPTVGGECTDRDYICTLESCPVCGAGSEVYTCEKIPGSTCEGGVTNPSYVRACTGLPLCTLETHCTADNDCGRGLICKEGLCSAPIQTVSCTADRDCATGQSCVNEVCAVPNVDTSCTSDLQCASGEVCENRVCTIVTPPSGCTTNDQCASGYTCQNRVCTAVTTTNTCTSDLQCASGYSCVDRVCTAQVKSASDEVKVEVFSSTGILSLGSMVNAGQKYTIRITVTPQRDLSTHLILAKVDYGVKTGTIFSNFQPALVENGEEVVEFTTTAQLDTTIRNMNVEAFVWNNWLSTSPGAVFESKGSAEVQYEVK